MSVNLVSDVVRLEGTCRVEDAEPLLMLLRADPTRTIDLTGAVHIHGAVAQVLLALRPTISGPAGDSFVTKWLIPLLSQEKVG